MPGYIGTAAAALLEKSPSVWVNVKPARYLVLPQLAYSRSQLALSRTRWAQEFQEVCFFTCALLCAGLLPLLNGFSLPAM